MCSFLLFVVEMYLFGIIENLRGIVIKDYLFVGVVHIIGMIFECVLFYCLL